MRTLETKRLNLRPWQLSDVKDSLEYAKSSLVGPDAGWKPITTENKVIAGFGLHESTPDERIKSIKQREVGYVLNPEYWGNGYIPEAVRKVLEYSFIHKGIDLVWYGHFEDNLQSKRVNEKCGFQFKFKKERELTSLENQKVMQWYYNLSRETYMNGRIE
ncbi:MULTISPECIES: GNAT family N-acetyltransferase [unclassified Oceanispirochaeta]|uniref:GNAT family N-acetyltransferase n=1 Tax=unclassified Oceanispirochaeta TaxID=2635722 RepID=UPI000E09ACCA|nr:MULTISPECIES: GNAT family N-acetyltransferase [unclassified Oceanispirochaeta]MBF9015402.1 GNAT family N-acetyltransferase [Oceanispirochaeta sp. M2]NPD71861.1 GNAT family N-acetyltransferase [Oceanispirochaeta sp. M1]RDG32670.1 N-acetyltransferase [Oceanispirochaeta sp. M1]